MSKEYMPSEAEIEELGIESAEITNVDGFNSYGYTSDKFAMVIYQKQFEPATPEDGKVEFVLQHPDKGIVFIGKIKSFDELKDQLERCQLS